MRTVIAHFQLKDEDHGTLTVTHCPALLALEKEDRGKEHWICREWEPRLMRLAADFFDPKIEVNALKLPPRKSQDEICCQYEFKLN